MTATGRSGALYLSADMKVHDIGTGLPIDEHDDIRVSKTIALDRDAFASSLKAVVRGCEGLVASNLARDNIGQVPIRAQHKRLCTG